MNDRISVLDYLENGGQYMKRHNGLIDLLKFIVMLLNIMGGHFVITGAISGGYPFVANGIFVEFYLIITGYFTACHFASNAAMLSDQQYLEQIFGYTLYKFSKFFPYIIIINSILLLRKTQFQPSLSSLWNFFLESMLLSEGLVEVALSNCALWLFSAMFLIFPLFCAFCLIRDGRIKLLLSLYLPLIYYANIDKAVNAGFPYGMIRVFCGMMIGAFLFYASPLWEKYLSHPKIQKLLPAAAIITMAIPILMAYRQMNYRRVELFFILLTLFLLFSCRSGCLQCKFTDFLGKFSMVICIVHWPVAVMLQPYSTAYSTHQMLLLYYGISIVVSALLMFFCEQIGKLLRRRIVQLLR